MKEYILISQLSGQPGKPVETTFNQFNEAQEQAQVQARQHTHEPLLIYDQSDNRILWETKYSPYSAFFARTYQLKR